MGFLRRLYHSRISFVISTSLLLIFIICDIVVFRGWIADLYPLDDEFSLIVESAVPSFRWLTEGFAGYFNVYPEYSSPITNFVRPIVNVVYYIFSPWSEYSYKSQLIVMNYGVHSAIAALLYFISEDFGNSKIKSCLIAITAFFAPAYWGSPMPIYPSYAFDGLAAIFCLIAALLLSRQFNFAGGIILLLAVFTKETAIPLAVSVMIYALFARSWHCFLAGFLTIGLWITARYLAFNTIGGGTYALGSFDFIGLLRRLFTVAYIPFGGTPVSDLKSRGLLSFEALLLIANVLFLGIICYITIILAIRYINKKTSVSDLFWIDNARSDFLFLCFVCCITSVLFLIVVDISSVDKIRISYVLFVMVLASIASATKFPKYQNYTVCAILVCSSVATFINIEKYYSRLDVDIFKYDSSRKLVDLLRGHKTLVDIPVFVVNDVVGVNSKQESIAKLSGVTTRLYRGSSIAISDCNLEDIRSIRTIVESSSSMKTLRVSIPNCARFTFEATDQDKIKASLSSVHLARNELISYRFPNIKLVRSLGGKEFYDFGGILELTVVNSPVIYFDFQREIWILLV